MSEYYIALWDDRHCDTDAFLFSDKQAAIDWADQKVREYDRFEEYEVHELNNDMVKSGWVYLGTYSCEGDGIRVMKVALDKEIK